MPRWTRFHRGFFMDRQPTPSTRSSPASSSPPGAASADSSAPSTEPAAEAPATRRIAICLQYDGSPYCGWQRQPHHPSVQEVLEGAIAQLDPHRPAMAVAAGRTDSGVHAAGQVVHFDVAGPIPAQRWAPALNGRLPASIRVRAAREVANTWHACFSASYRRYRYTLYNGSIPNLFLSPWSWHRYRSRLNEGLMTAALQDLLGEHDFSAFMRAGSNRAHGRTTVQAVELERQGDLIVAEIQASGFLYGMVRLLIGQVVAVGEGRLSLPEFKRRWRSQARLEVKEAAPPQGLCLLRVGYPKSIFPKAAWYDSQPRYLLGSSDFP